MGCCLIASVSCCVLYDSGATHSFVSDNCVKRLGLPVCELQCELAVSTPASGLVTTSSLCARCPVEVEGRRYKVNLQDLEVILGMDWLSANRVLIDCREKRLLFPDLEELELVSPQGAMREIQSGAQCFIIFARMEVGERERDHQSYLWYMSLKTYFWMKYQGCLPVEKWSSLSTWY
ncbi:uncharacterized protein LOC114195082 [Vigna unguiculata]|uniref:uncharacterized protein LOC114195082 n=1 Tax=Vigna unguiculata TaxID=3917 RepID=UPI0010161A49|nr:uncharacterized protein LOC114195082 [Vigna unguiculata]